MSNNQDDKTKKFIEEAKNIVDKGIEPTYKAIADKIGWHNNSLSMALKGKRNIPFEIYKKFTEIYKQPTLSIVREPDEDLKTKIIALQDQNIKSLEYIKRLEQQIKTQDSIQDAIEKAKEALHRELSVLNNKVDNLQEKLAERISSKLTEVEQVLEEVRLNQQVMYSVQDAYFDHWLDALPDKEAVRLAIQQKAREGAKKYRKQGIRL